MSLPRIYSATVVRRYWASDYEAELLERLEVFGDIDYEYAFVVLERGCDTPVMWVAAVDVSREAGAIASNSASSPSASPSPLSRSSLEQGQR